MNYTTFEKFLEEKRQKAPKMKKINKFYWFLAIGTAFFCILVQLYGIYAEAQMQENYCQGKAFIERLYSE
jgi:hypothetical protein